MKKPMAKSFFYVLVCIIFVFILSLYNKGKSRIENQMKALTERFLLNLTSMKPESNGRGTESQLPNLSPCFWDENRLGEY